MTQDEFRDMMQTLAEICADASGAPYALPQAKLDFYWQSLHAHDIEAVTVALNRWLLGSRFFPAVSDILPLISYSLEPPSLGQQALPALTEPEPLTPAEARRLHAALQSERIRSDVEQQVAVQRESWGGAGHGPRHVVPLFALPQDVSSLPFVRMSGRRLYECHQCLDAEWILLECPITACGRTNTHEPHAFAVRCPHWYERHSGEIRRTAATALQKGRPMPVVMQVLEQIEAGSWPYLNVATRRACGSL